MAALSLFDPLSGQTVTVEISDPIPAYDDEVTDEQLSALEDLVAPEFQKGDWTITGQPGW